MHPRQSPGGGRLSGLRYRVGFLAHRPNQLQRKDLRPMNSRTKEAIPPPNPGKDIVISPLGFFPPSLPRMSLFTNPTGVAN